MQIVHHGNPYSALFDRGRRPTMGKYLMKVPLHGHSLKLATKAVRDHLPICLFAASVGARDEVPEPFCGSQSLARIQQSPKAGS
jgi:hypothetical protein